MEGDDPYVTPQRGWRMWWTKRRWYDRTHRFRHRWRINRLAAKGGFYVRHPIEGEVLEALEDGRLTIGEGTLLEPGCWLTLGPDASIAIGRGCFLNRETMLAAHESIEIGDHVMFANGCFVGDADHRYDDPELPVTWQGFVGRGPVRIGANSWIGKGVVVTGGVEVGEHSVIGANSVVTRDTPPWTISAGAPAQVIREIERPRRGRTASLSPVRFRSTKPLAIAVLAAVSALLLAAGCGEKSEPPTSGPVVTQTTTGSTTTGPTTGSTTPTDEQKIQATVVKFLTIPNDPRVCRDLITPEFLKRSYGDMAGCIASRKPSAMAKAVTVKPVPGGAQTVVSAKPKGGVFGGQTLKVTVIFIEGQPMIDKITSNAKVGP